MDPRSTENVTEFVLDNRKLIVAFLMLAIVCGAFFVIGYMEGKRQAVPGMEGAATPGGPMASDDSTAGDPAVSPAAKSAAAAAENRDAPVKTDWYDKVQGTKSASSEVPATPKKGQSAEALRAETPPQAPVKAVKPPATKPQPAKQASATPAQTVESVQVGAFRQAREADAKAEELKKKGFTPIIEPPGAGGQYYLVKVGRFTSHAEAVAMQSSLRQAGFDCFIKKK